ncbi:hypothetical protein F2P81_005465 [Scophthalmus maximus]|uniref:Uncharacterized protein n=1 Tax=Scophthalmus maximus TaxID=52904 RepID=A0A6A4T7B4_SCOMX|nr:hypothetical protein F2P81_005465 [Scophthalmus maximus]
MWKKSPVSGQINIFDLMVALNEPHSVNRCFISVTDTQKNENQQADFAREKNPLPGRKTLRKPASPITTPFRYPGSYFEIRNRKCNNCAVSNLTSNSSALVLEVKEVESPQSPAGAASSQLRSAAAAAAEDETHIAETSARGRWKVGHRPPATDSAFLSFWKCTTLEENGPDMMLARG